MKFALWLRISATTWLVVLVPVYWHHYGPTNFLWFSDVALFLTVLNLYLADRTVASIAALIVVVPETVWIVDYVSRLLAGTGITGLADYMFDRDRPLYLRGLSLFHLWMPPLAVYQVWKLRYEPRALGWVTAIAWVLLPVTWLVTRPEDNINWVYGPGTEPQDKVSGPVYLGLAMLAFPLLMYMPAHFLLNRLFGRGRGRARVR